MLFKHVCEGMDQRGAFVNYCTHSKRLIFNFHWVKFYFRIVRYPWTTYLDFHIYIRPNKELTF